MEPKSDPTPTETGEIINVLKEQHEKEMETLKEQLQKRDQQTQALNEPFNKYVPYLKLMERNFKPNPPEQEIEMTEELVPVMENMLYKNPEMIAEIFMNNKAFQRLAFSKLSKEDLAKAKSLAKEENTTVNELLKKKTIEFLKKEKLSNDTE